MKVVLFCGGLGLRLREFAENIPKPLATIGYRPILWHVMKYYAHFGHKDFILCLGHRADTIKDYFVKYDEYVSNAVEKYLEGEETFLANYSDGLTDLPLPQQIEHFRKHDKIASFLCVRPNLSYAQVTLNGGDLVADIQDMAKGNIRINGGYFVFKKDIFRYIRDGEELVHEPFRRLVAEQQLIAHQYDGFWACMDTFKDKQHFDDLYAKGKAPWQVWNGH